MRSMRLQVIAVAVVLTALLSAVPSAAWGPEGHDIVTSKAISVLPGEIRPFYARNERLIVALAVLPDLWKDHHRGREGPNHYINLDRFGTPPLFDDLPKDRRSAERKFGKAGLNQQGILPWVVGWRYEKLVQAMKKQDTVAIVEQSAILAHYVADAHVPFHATKHYDGRQPDQKGLHGRFEIELLRRTITPGDIRPGPPEAHISSIEAAFNWCIEAYQYVDLLNETDRRARAEAGAYNRRYYELFAADAKPVAILQLEKGASNLAGLYLSAWIAAGKPPLEPKAAPFLWGK